ncbi:unannotated protein [freshwater metagenome]|uniref:Unannotated protein n=1 Tax=freshwater metagenome TaxID=449393 RepID=A0A6J7IL21_9ZZZZ
MHRVEMNAPRAEALGPHLVQRDLRSLRAGVLLGALVGLGRHLELRHRETRGVHTARRHGDHTRRRGPDQSFEQQCRQQERADDLARHRGLGAVGSHPTLGRERAGVVDQDVEPLMVGQHPRRELPHVHKVTHVGRHLRYRLAARRGAAGRGDEVVDDALVFLRVTADEHERGATRGELTCCRQTNTRCRAREQDNPTGEVIVVERRPVSETLPRLVSDLGEARDDGRFDDRVGEPLERCVHAVQVPSPRHGQTPPTRS